MISILIPAHNEAERIGETVSTLRATLPDSQIVVVDDGSQDETYKQAEAAGADVVFRQRQRGKGAALNRALALSTGKILLLLDADIGTSAEEATKLLAPVLNNEADMTIALFPQTSGSGGGFGMVVGRARTMIREFTGREMQAPLSGQRAVMREVIERCGGFAEGWGVEVALTVRALWKNYRVLEIPTEMTHRVTGRDMKGIWHRFQQYRSVGRVLRALESEMPDTLHSPHR